MVTMTDNRGRRWRKGYREIDHDSLFLPSAFDPRLEDCGALEANGSRVGSLMKLAHGTQPATYYLRWQPLNSEWAQLVRVFREGA